jgi:hypothetical protein
MLPVIPGTVTIFVDVAVPDEQLLGKKGGHPVQLTTDSTIQSVRVKGISFAAHTGRPLLILDP